MAKKQTKLTGYQRLNNALSGNWGEPDKHINRYDVGGGSRIFRTTDKEEYEAKKLEIAQNRYLSKQWIRTNRNLDLVEAFKGKNNMLLMYTDADFMDSAPEIASALDTVAEESTVLSDKGKVITVSSESNRIKAILEDLFENRLDMHIMSPMIVRQMCKYGNQFMLLDIDKKNGIKGWRQLPVYEMERIEHGIDPMFLNQQYNGENTEDMSTRFRWVGIGQGGITEFRNWQVAHFRLITNSMYLPYGVSWLNPARRHFRMLCLMEDMMLIYRLERSMERRVFKIFVGAMDDADIPAYMDDIANNFKRTPIVDPMTGLIDLRKNVLCTSDDYFIPVRDQSAPSPIESLAGASNLTALDDIKYVQNKVYAGLCVPRQFISFEETAGDGKNLALLDVRFARKINRVQQSFLMELNKIAIIHLYLLGFHDEISNFRLSMTNPSTQAEMMNVENLQKKIDTIRNAVADPGGGIPILSLKRALTEIMGYSEKDWKNNLEEIRLEKALAKELEKTDQIIQRSGLFDIVDRIYGEPGAKYAEGQQGGEGGDPMGGGPGGGGGGGFGGGLDSLGDMGGDMPEGDVGGMEGEMPASEMGGAPEGGEAPALPDGGGAPPMESSVGGKEIIDERGGTSFSIGEGLVVNGGIDDIIRKVDEYLNE